MPVMSNAINAYRAAAAKLDQPEGGSGTDQPGESFSAVLKHTLQDAIDKGKESEKLSADAIAGKADIGQVVTAVSNAQLALQTVVTVRDRVLSAYQQIMQMPV